MNQAIELAFDALYQIILPIFLAVGVGFVVGRKLIGVKSNPHADQNGLRTLSRLVFYLFAPCLVFSSLANSDVALSEVGQIGLFTLVITTLIGLVAWVLTRLLRLPPPETSSVLLLAMFANIGNFGLPLNELAFGPAALDRAVIFFVSSSILLFSLGILIAARAQESLTQSLVRVSRVPIVYALLLALAVRLGLLSVPDPVMTTTALLAQASVPLMLIILGIQLSSAEIHGNWRLLIAASSARLFVAPLIAIPLSGLLGLTDLAQQVSITEASMPSAVFNIILAIEFNLALDLTTSVVFITTLASPLTLIPLISFLR